MTLPFVAVRRVWLRTSWMTNWLDPDRIPLRLLLFVLLLAGPMISTSLPGAFAKADLRVGLRTLVVAIDLMSPGVGHWVPGLGRSRAKGWDVEEPHFAERCGLFILIALGESFLIAGATLEELTWDLPHF